MRIIADNHDYYDSCMKWGQDDSILFLRKEKTVRLPQILFPRLNGIRHKANLDCYFIGFCGQIYPLVRTNYTEWDVYTYKTTYEYYYSQEEFKASLDLDSSGHKLDKGFRKWELRNMNKTISEFFNWKNAYNLFDDAPIFVVKENYRGNCQEVHYNQELKHLQFFKIKDHYSAYQELAQWIGNQAEPRKTMPTISDEIMAEMHGFDKWSFRKQSTKVK